MAWAWGMMSEERRPQPSPRVALGRLASGLRDDLRWSGLRDALRFWGRFLESYNCSWDAVANIGSPSNKFMAASCITEFTSEAVSAAERY